MNIEVYVRVGFVDDLAAWIKDINSDDRSDRLLDSIAVGIVSVCSGGATINLGDTVFGVVSVVVEAIVSHIAGRVVLIRRDQAIIGGDTSMKGVARARRDGLVGAIAPGVVSPGKTFARLGGSRIAER